MRISSLRALVVAGPAVLAVVLVGIPLPVAQSFLEPEGLRVPSDQTLNACVYLGAGEPQYQVVSQTLRAKGGAPASAYSWRLGAGSTFPPGTTVSPVTGVFAGTGAALRPGLHDFTMVVSDGDQTAEGRFVLAVARSTEICPRTAFRQWPRSRYDLGTARVGAPFGGSLFVRGGTPPYRWIEDTSYPRRAEFAASGLRINRETGIVDGIPAASTVGRVLRFRILVRDANGELADSVAGEGAPVYSIRIVGSVPPVSSR